MIELIYFCIGFFTGIILCAGFANAVLDHAKKELREARDAYDRATQFYREAKELYRASK